MKKYSKLKAVICVFVAIVSFAFPTQRAYAQSVKVYLGGEVLGFNIETNGATIVSFSDVITEGGLKSPCREAGLMVGDVVLELSGESVSSSTDVSSIVSKSKNSEIVVKYKRNNETRLTNVLPALDLAGVYRLGLYLKGDMSGLGTVTYYKENGEFGALGHPVCDSFGDVVSLKSGCIYKAGVVGVNKATYGKAGEIRGVFLSDKQIGNVSSISETGLYGKNDSFSKYSRELVTVAIAKPGKAEVYTTVEGEKPRFYEIDIVKVDRLTRNNKNMVIKICDKELLSVTGGILQGMSGSPILQDGKLVGAITHVFLNDSTRGYAISIQNMLIA